MLQGRILYDGFIAKPPLILHMLPSLSIHRHLHYPIAVTFVKNVYYTYREPTNSDGKEMAWAAIASLYI